MGDQVQLAILAAVVAVLTGTTTHAFAIWREQRTRAWIKEDRRAELNEIVDVATAQATAQRIKAEATAEALRIEALGVAENLRIEALGIAERLALEARKNTSLLREEQRKNVNFLEGKIADAKTAADVAAAEAKAAVTEANSTNAKIEQLNRALLRQGQTLVEVSAVGLAAGVAGTQEIKALTGIAHGNTDRLEVIKETVVRIDERGTVAPTGDAAGE